MTLGQRTPRAVSKSHLRFIRQMPCLICKDNTSTEAAHLRMAGPGKPWTGFGIKPDDKWVLPLCGTHHRSQHSGAERKFWDEAGIDPFFYCEALWGVSGDFEQASRIIDASTPRLSSKA